MTDSWRGFVGRMGVGVLVGGAVILAFATALLVPTRPELALLLSAAVFMSVLTLVSPAILPLLAVPMLVVSERASVGGIGMSLADFALVAALGPAIILSPRPLSPTLRSLLWVNAAYQAATLFTVLANPFLANTVDWFHNWMIISGGLMVGWAVGRGGLAGASLRLFLTVGVVLALVAVGRMALNYAQGNFEALYPTWPFEMHKNFFGNLMCFVTLIFYARPTWIGLPKRLAYCGFWISAVALAGSQSRQAIVALAVGLLIIAVRGGREHRRGWLSIFIGVPAFAFVLTMVREQIASGNEHNSYFQRLEWYDQSIANWQSSPWFGLGLRYWNEGRGGENFHPPQAFLEVLATTGLIGLAGFIVLILGTLKFLWALPGLTGSLALALVSARLVQGQLDIFWLSPTTTTPFVLAGICLGVLAAREARETPVRSGAEVEAHV